MSLFIEIKKFKLVPRKVKFEKLLHFIFHLISSRGKPKLETLAKKPFLNAFLVQKMMWRLMPKQLKLKMNRMNLFYGLLIMIVLQAPQVIWQELSQNDVIKLIQPNQFFKFTEMLELNWANPWHLKKRYHFFVIFSNYTP